MTSKIFRFFDPDSKIVIISSNAKLDETATIDMENNFQKYPMVGQQELQLKHSD